MAQGRPTKYSQEMHDRYCAMAEQGATESEIAAALGVNTDTLYEWASKHPIFSEARKAARDKANDHVEAALFKMATGLKHRVVKPMEVKDGDGVSHIELVEYEERLPPNPTSMIFWLKNRRPDRWRDKQELEVDSTVEIKHSFDPEGV
mgnify:CR=1 FL=1